MRLIKMVRLCTIFTCLCVPLLISTSNAQGEDPFNTESSDWPDMNTETPVASEPAPATVPDPEPTPLPKPEPKKEQPAPVIETVKPEPKPDPKPVAPVYQESTPTTTPSSSYNSTGTSSSSSTSTQKNSYSEPVQTTKTAYVSSSKALKRAGPPRILVCRPVYAPYTEELKTTYISSITEAYFHFKLNALPGYQVISQERVANNLQYFRDFTRRISRTSYIDAAQQLGASYLFYVEYEPQGKKVKFNVEFYSLTENKKLISSIQQIDLANFEDGLFNCLNEITSSLSDKFSDDVQKMLGSSILGKNAKSVETLGNLIVSLGDYSKARAEGTAGEYEKIANQNGDFHLAKMVAASTLALAQKYEKATQQMDKLIYEYGNDYPALYLQLASIYRQAQQYNDALDAAEKAARSKSIELLAKTEKARIYEAKGDLRAAKNEYQSVLSAGGEDGDIFFQLALVSIGLNDLSNSSSYISKAETAGRQIDRGDYYDIGLRYKNLGTANEKAIEAFKNSLGIQQDKEDAWLQLAEVYSKMGREDEAAQCYINLFHINNSVYKDYLPKAGFKFEALGMMDKAKEAYSLFIARRYTDPEVSVRLAKIEVADNNCEKAAELVRDLDTNTVYGSDIKKVNEQCHVQQRHVVVNTETKQQKGKAAVFMWRVFSGIITAGGLGAGYFINTMINDKITEYQQRSETWLGYTTNQSARISTDMIAKEKTEIDNLHTQIETFKLYRNVSYGAGGIGAASLTLSIVIPIISKK